MNKINIFLSAVAILLAAGCTNMNPDVKYDPKTDADAYCAIGKKDSKTASLFWDKVEKAYNSRLMYDELDVFENIIVEKSQVAALEHPVRIAKRSMTVREGEVSYYPDQDAQTYLDLLQANKAGAEEFYNEVVELYNTDGMYEDLEIFYGLCGTK